MMVERFGLAAHQSVNQVDARNRVPALLKARHQVFPLLFYLLARKDYFWAEVFIRGGVRVSN